MKNYLLLGLVLFFTSLTLISCSDDDDNKPSSVVEFSCFVGGVEHTYTYVLGDGYYLDASADQVTTVVFYSTSDWNEVYEELQQNCDPS